MFYLELINNTCNIALFLIKEFNCHSNYQNVFVPASGAAVYIMFVVYQDLYQKYKKHYYYINDFLPSRSPILFMQ